MKNLRLMFLIVILLAVVGLTATEPAFTDSGWSTRPTQVKVGPRIYNVWTCTVTSTTGDTIAYTSKTPIGLNTTQEWELIVNAEGNTLDGTTLPVSLVGGYSADAILTRGYAQLTYTDCVLLKTIEADVQASVGSITIDPNLTTADVTDTIVNIEKMPYYIFTLQGTSALVAASCVFKIVQVSKRSK